MNRKYVLPLIALVGIALGIATVMWSQRKTPTPPILFPPPTSPYTASIAASGIIESSSKNIDIGSPFNELVTDIFVLEGDFIKTGDPLFQLDIRGKLAQAEKAQASVNLAIVTLEDKKSQFGFYERLKDKSAVSEQAYLTAYFAMKEAEENLRVEEANLGIIETDIERSTIRSPLDALILQVNVRPGQIAPTVPFTTEQSTLMLLGNVNPLYVRVSIDEDDCWRFKKGAHACAFVRGNSCLSFPLNYVRTEPLVIPKSSYTGDTQERIDTRVLEVLYCFDYNNLPIYPGQILDIFIEADPIDKWMNLPADETKKVVESAKSNEIFWDYPFSFFDSFLMGELEEMPQALMGDSFTS